MLLLGLANVAQSSPIAVQAESDQQTTEIEALVYVLENWSTYEYLNTPMDAMQRLGEIGQPSIPYLVGLLQNPDQDVRGFASGAFREMAESAQLAAVPQILPLLNNSDSAVRLSALSALTKMGESANAAEPHVRPLLDDPEEQVEIQASVALKKIGAPISSQMIERLISFLKEPNPGTRFEAALALGEMGELAEPAVPELILLLEDQNLRTFDIAHALGDIGESAQLAIPYLALLLDDSDQGTRQGAIEALDKIGKSAQSEITKALQNSDHHIRFKAASALGNIGQAAQSSIPNLIQLLTDSEEWVRLQAVIALGKMGEPAKVAIPNLIKRFEEDPSNLVRRRATEALTRLRSLDASLSR